MTPEAQQIAIQKAFGWESYTHICSGGSTLAWRCNTPTKFTLPPNYLLDLNAMHEAVTKFAKERDWQYSVTLVEGRWSCGIYNLIPQIIEELGHAYGEEQCPTLAKAFLRALNLWTT